MQAQEHLQNANYELSVKESDLRGGSRGWEQGNGAESGNKEWEQGGGRGGGSRVWEHGMETLGGRKEWEQKAGAEYGKRGWEQGVGRSNVWQMAKGEQGVGIAVGSGGGAGTVVGRREWDLRVGTWRESWGGNRRAGGGVGAEIGRWRRAEGSRDWGKRLGAEVGRELENGRREWDYRVGTWRESRGGNRRARGWRRWWDGVRFGRWGRVSTSRDWE
jgi:hypothetical protein